MPQTFVQYVVPGSPAFVAGLFPGDCILEVNGQDMHHCHANEVVSAIQRTKGERLGEGWSEREGGRVREKEGDGDGGF